MKSMKPLTAALIMSVAAATAAFAGAPTTEAPKAPDAPKATDAPKAAGGPDGASDAVKAECRKQADAKGLKGDEAKKFKTECKDEMVKSGVTPPATTPAPAPK